MCSLIDIHTPQLRVKLSFNLMLIGWLKNIGPLIDHKNYLTNYL